MRKVQWKRKKEMKETDFINKNQKLSVLKSVLKLWFSKNMKLGLVRVFTELVACKVHHTYHDGSKRSCTLVCVFQTRSCKIVIDHRQKEFLPNNKRKESTALLPDWSSKLCGLNFNLYTGTHGGAFFVLDVQMPTKKKPFMFLQLLAHHAKKSTKLHSHSCNSLSPQNGFPFFILIFS
jgi:hypothetical protein